MAAAGAHNCLMTGSPGTGKTHALPMRAGAWVARALPSILPRLSLDEALDITRIYSVTGKLSVLVQGNASIACRSLLVALANYLDRRSLAIVSLFAAGLIMTALNPLTLWDVGFQPSFLATLSLVLFATPMTERFERLLARLLPARAAKPVTGFLNDALIVTLAAQILTLPLIAHDFGRLSVVSPLANLLVLPVQPAVMIWGGVGMGLGILVDWLKVLEPVARGVMLVPWLALHWTVTIIHALAALPFASANVHLSAGGLAGYYALLGAAMLTRRPSLPLVGSRLCRIREAMGSSKR